MKALHHPATTAFGATTIILLILLVPLASFTHTEFYHLVGPVSAVVVPVLLNFIGIWLLLMLLLSCGSKYRWVNTCIWAGLAITLPWLLLKAWFTLKSGHMPPAANLAFLVVLLVAAAALLTFRSHASTFLRYAKKVAVTLLGFVALSGVVMLAEALFFAGQARQLNAPRPLHQSTAAVAPNHSRIVWIVLDELSYRQVYEHRYPGLQMPAFDRLAAESTVFTHAVPIAPSTELVLPSLFTGISTYEIFASAAGWPVHLRTAPTQAWQPLDPHNTVFQDALNAGYTTALAGWYNPYCRLLPEVLDHCFWTSHVSLPGGMFPGQAIGWNTQQLVWHHLVYLAGRLHLAPQYLSLAADTGFHQQDYKELLAAGDKLLDLDPSITFLLLHMPIPHPPGIYNRHTASFAASPTTYIDNLALCDAYLAHVRQELEKKGEWDSATLVLIGDHSWRTHLYALAAPLTAEELAATHGGQFDDRPAYIVKLPGQRTPARIDTPFAALRTREFFKQLLAGHIHTPQQLADWAKQGN